MHKCVYNLAPFCLSQMFTQHEAKLILTYQSIGLQPVKEHLNTEELKFGVHWMRN